MILTTGIEQQLGYVLAPEVRSVLAEFLAQFDHQAPVPLLEHIELTLKRKAIEEKTRMVGEINGMILRPLRHELGTLTTAQNLIAFMVVGSLKDLHNPETGEKVFTPAQLQPLVDFVAQIEMKSFEMQSLLSKLIDPEELATQHLPDYNQENQELALSSLDPELKDSLDHFIERVLTDTDNERDLLVSSQLFSEVVQPIQHQLDALFQEEVSTVKALIEAVMTLTWQTQLSENDAQKLAQRIGKLRRNCHDQESLISILKPTQFLSLMTDDDDPDSEHNLANTLMRYDIVPVVRSVVSDFQMLAQSKNISVELDYQQLPEAKLMVDLDHIKTLIRNLVSNAVKYTDEGKVSIHMSQEPDTEDTNIVWVVISVTDTGRGIHHDEVSSIFGSQIRGRSSHGTEGMGIGLSIVQRIASFYKAKVEVTSQEGQGSTFKITFRALAQGPLGVTS